MNDEPATRSRPLSAEEAERQSARPRPAIDRPAASSGIQRPLIVAALYLANLVLGISVFIGLILAYVWRGEADTPEWERTHYTYLIRTFWISFVAWLLFIAVFFTAFIGAAATEGFRGAEGLEGVGVLAALVFILLFLAMGVWFCVRSVISIAKAASGKPIDRPETWMF